MPKPLAGRHELLLTHEELCGSGEDHRNVRRVEHIVLKDKVKKIKNWLKNQISSSLDQKKELEMTLVWEKEGPVVSTSSKPATEMSKYKPKGPQKKKKGPKNHEGKGKGKDNWHRPYPQGYRSHQIGTFSSGQCFKYGQNSYRIHSKREGKDEQDFSMQLIDEIQFVRSSIDVELDKCDAKYIK
ncbi:hypothetical protein O181_123252 [Austropuccinia psidii MF-1]|uniref:Uncharacterized protein n=1 Tax=Austropuccinia psidii MF-1 TaxID=1389203 RepID=A0A9Q3Q588_9BASI|nr:hypothetical protein [Austropuccinia psidii MF-1]